MQDTRRRFQASAAIKGLGSGKKDFAQETSAGKMKLLIPFRTLVLWVAIGCTLFGFVSLFIPDSSGSLLYLVGFPLLCLMLFF
jgi:hypothetical protein